MFLEGERGSIQKRCSLGCRDSVWEYTLFCVVVYFCSLLSILFVCNTKLNRVASEIVPLVSELERFESHIS